MKLMFPKMGDHDLVLKPMDLLGIPMDPPFSEPPNPPNHRSFCRHPPCTAPHSACAPSPLPPPATPARPATPGRPVTRAGAGVAARQPGRATAAAWPRGWERGASWKPGTLGATDWGWDSWDFFQRDEKLPCLGMLGVQLE